MSIALSDVIPLVKDYARNQNLTDARAIRALNSATAFIQSTIGLPGYEREFQINFDEDQPTYDLPVDYGEPISLRFQDDRWNEFTRWSYWPAELMFERVNAVDATTFLFGEYLATGSPTMYILAKNTTASLLIDSFDQNQTTNWAATLDANNITSDPYTKKDGSASLKFDIFQNVSNRGSITANSTLGPFNMTAQQTNGIFKCWVWLPNITNFTSVSLSWGSDNANYFKNTQTTQSDGTAFIVGWNMLAWPFTDTGTTQVGSPDVANIDYFKFDFDYTGAFVPTPSFRLDLLRLVVPDILVLTYYTTYKGQTGAGAKLLNFTATTDQFLFQNIDPSLMEIIAIYASVILNPTILVENDHVRLVYDQFLKTWKARFPRKRVKNLLASPKVARTALPLDTDIH